MRTVDLIGYWKITKMDEWDQDYVDLVVPGFIEFEMEDDHLLGSFQFGTVSGSQLTIRPITDRRTPSRASTSVYSSRMSRVTSHVKVSCSIHSWRNRALRVVGTAGFLRPATPATRTEVSTTPLRRL